MGGIPPDDVIVTDWSTARVWLRWLRYMEHCIEREHQGVNMEHVHPAELAELQEYRADLERLLGEE
jgi:hypothetical protein